MTISELIEQLELIKALSGDIEVRVENLNYTFQPDLIVKKYPGGNNMLILNNIYWEIEMSRIPEFLEALEIMKGVHIKKNKDYADSNNPFSNFDVSEYCISLFKSNRDKTFVWPIATKLARLSTLLNSNKIPNNESIEDSFIDIANYVLLWRADYIRRLKP